MRCAKFGVVVFKASMVNCRGQSAMGICTLFYIYRSAMRCAKFFCSSITGIYSCLGG